MAAVDQARTDHLEILDWVQVGGVGGSEITLGGHLLRHNALRISGSEFRSVPMELADLPGLAAMIARDKITVRRDSPPQRRHHRLEPRRRLPSP